MYGGNWTGEIGTRVEIRKFQNNETDDLEFQIMEGFQPEGRFVGKTGTIIDVQDDRYDTEYPTGYECITLLVKFDETNEERSFSTKAVKKI